VTRSIDLEIKGKGNGDGRGARGRLKALDHSGSAARIELAREMVTHLILAHQCARERDGNVSFFLIKCFAARFSQSMSNSNPREINS
jgi:hypothetical protein